MNFWDWICNWLCLYKLFFTQYIQRKSLQNQVSGLAKQLEQYNEQIDMTQNQMDQLMEEEEKLDKILQKTLDLKKQGKLQNIQQKMHKKKGRVVINMQQGQQQIEQNGYKEVEQKDKDDNAYLDEENENLIQS